MSVTNYKGWTIHPDGKMYRGTEHYWADGFQEAKMLADEIFERNRLTEDELTPGDVLSAIKSDKPLLDQMDTIVSPRVRDIKIGSDLGQAKQAERVKELEGLLQKFASLNEHHENFKCIAGYILKARKVLQS